MADTSEDAYGKVVDRLMDSDEYAERMTSEWLDVARYSDTYGYQVDRNQTSGPGGIGSFNPSARTSPTTASSPSKSPETSFQTLPGTRFSPPASTVCTPKKSKGKRAGRIPHRVRDRPGAYLRHGLSRSDLECTRCHDHKYDPVTQKDYFSLSAFFNNIDEAGLYSYFTGSVPTPTLELGDLPSDEKIRQAEAKLVSVCESEETNRAFRDWTRSIEEKRIGRAVFFSQKALATEKPKKNRNPGELASLWLDASGLDSSAETWNDLSGRKNRKEARHLKAHPPQSERPEGNENDPERTTTTNGRRCGHKECFGS